MFENYFASSEHTAREIAQQPRIWLETRDAAQQRRAQIDAFFGEEVPDNARIVLTGAGTSAFIGQIAAPLIAQAAGRRVEAIATTDIVADPRRVFAEDVPTLLVSFARSGRSPESIAATELADTMLSQVNHLIITCDQSGDLYTRYARRSTDLVLLTPPGTNDAGFAMTSSFTSMLLMSLLVFSPELAASVAGLVKAGQWALGEGAELPVTLGERAFKRVVYLGSGPLQGLAQESALKLLELTAGQVVGLHDSALGFRHGPKSVLEHHTLVVVYVSSDPYTRKYDLDIANELVATPGDHTVVMVSATPVNVPGATTWLISGIADVPGGVVALPYVVFAQIFALGQLTQHGLTPDNPFPLGSVNRVVQGVRIHPLENGVTS